MEDWRENGERRRIEDRGEDKRNEETKEQDEDDSNSRCSTTANQEEA